MPLLQTSPAEQGDDPSHTLPFPPGVTHVPWQTSPVGQSSSGLTQEEEQ
jgi:hypothetical protein